MARTTAAEVAEQAAIAFALADDGRTTIYSDSRSAVRKFAEGTVSKPVLRILREKKIKQRATVWVPAHMGQIKGTPSNLNESAHRAARGVVNRVAIGWWGAELPDIRDPPASYIERTKYFYLGRRNYPPPHSKLNRLQALTLRLLQVGPPPWSVAAQLLGTEGRGLIVVDADKLLLFYANIKTSGLYGDNKYKAGVSLANNLMRYLWSNVPSDYTLDVIISVFSVSDKDVFRGALDAISQAENSSVYLDHVGFDVSGYSLLDTIAGTYEDLGVVRHRWQGDGSINCLIDIYPAVRTHAVTSRRTARNTTHDYVDKAYVWTADRSTTIRRFLRAGIDGILSNVPTNVLSILQEEEFSKIFKLATSEDDPWLRIA
ncbi:dermonecrotic toxin SPH-like [Dermacentor albipictus]|uniref:dermonecrotic toxin SPH-like n=1 Tax=Dermacentor albipictus TaxID=60249 RepID=UPI0038FC41C6